MYGIKFKIETSVPVPDYDRSVCYVMMCMMTQPYHRLIDGDQMIYKPFAGGFYLTMLRPYEIKTGKWLDKPTCQYIHLDQIEYIMLNPDKHFNITHVSAEYVSQ